MEIPQELVVTPEKAEIETNVAVEIIPDSNVVKRYNDAADSKDAAEELMDQLKPELLKVALRRLFKNNTTHPDSPLTSVRVQDETGERAIVSFTAKYAAVDKDAATDLFAKLGQNPDDFIRPALAATFDTTCFFVDGAFDQKRFDAFVAAIQKVAEKFEIDCPLALTPGTVVCSGFHEKRWHSFTYPQQYQVTEALPNTVTVKSERKKKKKAVLNTHGRSADCG